jgi:chaperonin GroEL
MNTKILFKEDAKLKILKGVKILAEAVGSTLGPRSLSVAIDQDYTHKVIDDGVGVARAINLKDKFENLGVKIGREAAQKTVDVVGDGTSATIVLLAAIIEEALKIISSGVNPMRLRGEIELASKKVLKELETIKTKVTTKEQKIQVATISCKDEVLGKLIADTIIKIGDDGIITVEESKMSETTIEMQDGMQFERGYAHPFMITEPERMIAVLEDVHVLISDIPLNNLVDIGKFLETQVLSKGVVKMVFIVPEVGGDFLQAMLGAKINGKFLGLVVKNPMIGSHSTEFLQDLCAMTGAKLVSKEAGHKFEDIDLNWCGRIGRIVSGKLSTTITKGAGHKDEVLQRIAIIKKQMEDETLTDFDKEKLKERMAKLTKGVAVVKVGGETEVEMKERKERATDAVLACQSAIKNGIVPGGEIAFLLASSVLKDSGILGEQILYHALKKPFKQLVENAGFDSGEMLNEFNHLKGQGLDVTTGEWKDMVKEGIVDPFDCPETAIKVSVSVANQILSIGCCITPDDDVQCNCANRNK